jgi:NAD(P)-dependent dehydrogenase (short-subunit alcohol dehydrogenase family)
MTSKTWFITGTSSGFGMEWARAALARGDRVAGTARDPSMIEDIAAEYGDAFLPLQLDVKDREADFAAVQRAHEHFGRLDVVINNAGYAQLGMIEELTEQQVRDEFDTNAFGALWITQAALPILRAQGSGHFVQVSSVAGIFAYPGVGMYNASKWALEGWCQALAQEVAGFGIRVTIIEPGGFATGRDSRAGHTEHLEAYSGVWEMARKRAMGRSAVLGDPKASIEAILQIVDADDPPLRVFLGTPWLESAIEEYEGRLAEWRRSQPLAELSEGAEATARWRELGGRVPLPD